MTFIFEFTLKASKIALYKKYDIVYVSNIRDWIFDFDNYNEIVVFRYINNILKLLKRNGIAIRSNVDSLYGFDTDDTHILDSYFKCNKIDSVNKSNLGYYYVEK